jgi:hypothetical protein
VWAAATKVAAGFVFFVLGSAALLTDVILSSLVRWRHALTSRRDGAGRVPR